MKKLLSFAAAALAVSTLFVSCASKQAADSMVPSVKHPRTYIVDLADTSGPKTTAFFKNSACFQNNQNDFCFTDYWKLDPPKAGDTIEVHYKGVSDIDITGLELGLIDQSPAASYWQGCFAQADQDNKPLVTDIKAGVEFSGVTSYVVAKNMTKHPNVQFYMWYDNNYTKNNNLPKVGKAANITWSKTDVNTTNIEDELVPGVGGVKTATGPQAYTIKVDDVAKMFAFEQESDGSVITQYAKYFDITEQFPDNLPKAGDTVTITFKGKSDRNIPEDIMCHMYESTPAVNWWSEITEGQYLVLGSNVVEGEPFEFSTTFTITKDCVEGCGVSFYYAAGDDIKAATWIFTK